MYCLGWGSRVTYHRSKRPRGIEPSCSALTQSLAVHCGLDPCLLEIGCETSLLERLVIDLGMCSGLSKIGSLVPDLAKG